MNVDFVDREFNVVSSGSYLDSEATSAVFVWPEDTVQEGSWRKQTECHSVSTEHFTTQSKQLYYSFPEEVKFADLIRQWHDERSITSSLSEMIVCPSYLRIIAMGELALPLILAQLRNEHDDPDHWFAALEAITGQDPVPENAYGDTLKMADAWLLWAKEENVW